MWGLIKGVSLFFVIAICYAIGVDIGVSRGRIDVASGEYECVQVFDEWKCGRVEE